MVRQYQKEKRKFLEIKTRCFVFFSNFAVMKNNFGYEKDFIIDSDIDTTLCL